MNRAAGRFQSFGAQDIAFTGVRPDDPQADVHCLQFVVQAGEHSRAGQVHIGRIRQVADDQLQTRRRGAHPIEHITEHVIHIEVKQHRLDAEDQHARNQFVVRMPRDVRETIGAGNAAEKGDVRCRGSFQQH